MDLGDRWRGVAAERAVLASLPDAVVIIDAHDGHVLWGNRAAEEKLGASLQAPPGFSGLDLIHHDDHEQALLAMATVAGKTVGTPLELRIRTALGWRLAEVIGAPMRDDNSLLVLCMRDLTERRRWEVAGDETAKLRALVHHAASLFILVRPGGDIEATSGAITRLLGHDQGELERQPLSTLVHPQDRAALAAAIDRAGTAKTQHGRPERVEVRLVEARSKGHVPYELSIVDLGDDPTVRGIVITGHDVSERSAAEEELRETLSLLNATLDSTADGILVVDLEGSVRSFNARFVEMWSLPSSIVQIGDDAALLRAASRQLVDPEAFLSRARSLYEDPESDGFDVLHLTDGRVIERYSMPQRVEGQVVGRVWSFHDVTRQQQLERQLEHEALHDSLTGLANQALFRDRVAHAIDAMGRSGGGIAVLYLDIDDFKRVNDSLGHLTGDHLLRAVSERLRGCVRDCDTTARLGGDEFAVLIEGYGTRRDVVDVAERIVDAFALPVRLGSREVVSSVSIGIAYSTAGDETETVLRNADLAMYSAKRQGKARFALYAPELHTAAIDRLDIEADLRAATARGEFRVFYQPIVDLRTQRMTGVEALLRWQHPTRGLLGPDRFISAAEDLGVIGEIGEFVLREACRQLEVWRVAGKCVHLSMSINVSSLQLTNGSIVDQVRRVLASTAIEPSALVLELTETAMMQDTPTAARALASLKELGVRLALDDFGTGFSSLTHLQQFPIDIIKIDRSFMTTAVHDSALIAGVIRLAEALGLVTVAEGIETAEQVAFLQAAGCHFGQGHFWARPTSARLILDSLPGARSSAGVP